MTEIGWIPKKAVIFVRFHDKKHHKIEGKNQYDLCLFLLLFILAF